MSEGKSLTGRVAEPLILELFDGQTDIPYGEIKEKVTELHLSRGGLPETSPTSFPITNSLSRLKKQGKANNPTKGYWSIKNLFEKSFDTVWHQVNGSNVHHSLSRLSRAFIVQSQSAKPTEPRKGALHNPAQWDNHKSRLTQRWGDVQFTLMRQI